jgi:hypothetical protein
MKRRLGVVRVCAVLAAAGLASLVAAGQKHHVLVLASRDSQQPAYEQFMSGFRTGVNAPVGAQLELFTEFFDSSRFPQAEHRMRMRQLLQEKELFFEFGATYRLPSLSLGKAGRLTFEPLAGGRFMWVEGSLGFPNQKVSDNGSVIDPMVGGRIAWHITDTVALWFRGDAAGFGISDNQSEFTYNLIGGLEWRFHPRASALVGFRYMNIDLEKDHRVGTFDADIEMYGPFLGVNFHFLGAATAMKSVLVNPPGCGWKDDTLALTATRAAVCGRAHGLLASPGSDDWPGSAMTARPSPVTEMGRQVPSALAWP